MMHEAGLFQIPFSPAYGINRIFSEGRDFAEVTRDGDMMLLKQE
jgi:hypothetical protein